MSRDYKLDHKLKGIYNPDDILVHIHAYNIDVKSNHIYLFGDESRYASIPVGECFDTEPGVEFTMANRFIKNLNICMRTSDDPILIHMKTCGGFWEEGMAIYDAIKSCPTPITILNYTHARSMSSIVFQAATKRVMMPNSYFMFHEGTYGDEGTWKQITSGITFYDKSKKTMLDIYTDLMKNTPHSKYVKWSENRISNWLQDQMDKKEDVFLTAEETVEHGLADEIFNYNWENLTKYTDEQLSR